MDGVDRGGGTPRAIGPIADEVLVWVAREQKTFRELKDNFRRQFPQQYLGGIDRHLDEIRRIELCALAAREAAMFHDLYGIGVPHATTPEVPEQRGASGGLPQAPEGGQGQPPGCGR